MSTKQSVSRWIEQLQAGQPDAIEGLWQRYIGLLVELARKRLDGIPKRVADEEDVAQSVFLSLCRGALAGRFADLKNRDELWWLLIGITRQKMVDLVRRETAQKRGGGFVQVETGGPSPQGNRRAFTLDELISEEPTPEFLVMIEEQNRHLLGLLENDQLRSVAVSRVEGYSVAEIAESLKISTRSVERKLKLIRAVWTEEFDRVERESSAD